MAKEKSGRTDNQENFPNSATVEFLDGSVTYSVYGEPSQEHNPILIVNGFENSRTNTKDLAELLAVNRQVIIYDQPMYKEDVPSGIKKNPDQAVGFQARAALAICEDAGLVGEDRQLDLVAISFGSLVAEELKKQASSESKGYESSFDSENGAHLALVVPAGSNESENLAYLAGRWAKYVHKGVREQKVMDPTKAKGNAVVADAVKQPAKTTGEIRALSSNRIDYANIGDALMLVYPEDKMFPDSDRAKDQKGIINEIMTKEYPVRVATPVNPEDVAINGMDLWLTKLGVKGKKKRLEFALSHRGAGHDDPTNNPERTAAVLLNYFDDKATATI